MIIYVTQKQSTDKHGQSLDVLETRYNDYFQQNSFFPPDALFLPVSNALEQVVKLIDSIKPDCIIFTGGNNVKPVSLAEQESVGDFCPKRDEVEQYLIQYADRNNIPKLAICRGFQFLNVYYGGKLSYFLPEHAMQRRHQCEFENQELMVNSYHQHGIYPAQLSNKLKAIALSVEQHPVVEAYINVAKDISPTLGVQWHPERDDIQPDLFKMIWEKLINESGHFSCWHGQAAR